MFNVPQWREDTKARNKLIGHQLIAQWRLTCVLKTTFHFLQSNNVLRSSHISAVSLKYILKKEKSNLCSCYICCTEVCFSFKRIFEKKLPPFHWLRQNILGSFFTGECKFLMASSQEKLLSVSLRMCVGEQKEYVAPHPGTMGRAFFWEMVPASKTNSIIQQKQFKKKSAMTAVKDKTSFVFFIYK